MTLLRLAGWGSVTLLGVYMLLCELEDIYEKLTTPVATVPVVHIHNKEEA